MAGLGFMVGTWVGEKDGDPVEEHWFAEKNGVMVGTMRWYKGGELHLTELIEIALGPPTFLLARHFRAGLAALEDRPVAFELESSDASRAVWRLVAGQPVQRMLYQRRGATLSVWFEAEEGPPLVGGTFRFSLA